MRVEAPVGLHLDETLAREHAGERAMNQANPVLELELPVLDGRLHRPLEVVEHREQLDDQPLGRPGGEGLLVAGNPLAVVVELGLQTLERVEILVALLGQPGDLGGECVDRVGDRHRGGGVRRLGPFVANPPWTVVVQDVFASSLSSTTS